jgi:predicted O-methyltransferase YrrM
MCEIGTASYEREVGLPPLVERAVELARFMDFAFSCHPAQGRLLSLLVAGRPGGVIGETGTGCGVGLAWMLSASAPGTRLISVEQDATRAEASRALFSQHRQVRVVTGDWRELLKYGPFDLLVLDGGGSGKTRDDTRIQPREALRPGGALVIDDWKPWDIWPPSEDGEFAHSRRHWLEHPDLLTSEVRLTPSLSTVVATRRQ